MVPALILCEKMHIPIANKYLELDATTAIVATARGFSRLLMHLEKTAGVALATLRDIIDTLGLQVVKKRTEEQDADTFTKPLSGVQLTQILPRVGVTSAR